MENILLLGSKSASRKRLLDEAKIPYKVIEQDADETKCDWALPLPQVVEKIARYKMEHVILPQGKEGDICYVLTADTLSQDMHGEIHGKPVDRADAIDKIRKARGGSQLCTAFCLDRKVFKNGAWQLAQRIERCVGAEHFFIIPDDCIEKYLDNSPGLSVSNAIAVEEYGAQFLKAVHGSFSTIEGLPMFELRESLDEIGFF